MPTEPALQHWQENHPQYLDTIEPEETVARDNSVELAFAASCSAQLSCIGSTPVRGWREQVTTTSSV